MTTTVQYARRALKDLQRLTDFLVDANPVVARETIDLILEAVEILGHHPQIGRPGARGYRELLISRGRTGYVALYRYDEARGVITILTVRHQRESGVLV